MTEAPGGSSPLARLGEEPEAFSFDAAVRLLCLAAGTTDPAIAARFEAPHGLAFPPGDVLRLLPGSPPGLAVALMGLSGPSGVLPRHYSEAVVQQVRGRARSLPDFLDLLAQRLVAHFAAAGMKYRPHRVAEAAALADPPGPGAVALVLLSLSGHGTPHLSGRVAAGDEALMHYAGLLTAGPRSAERLRALVSDWLGQPAEVVQFAGAWLALPPSERTRLGQGRIPGRHARLGVDAAAGVRAWDASARIILRLGPLPAREFDALLPDQPGIARLVSLIRTHLGLETGFAINPVLARDEVQRLRFDAAANPAPRLGWNTWLGQENRRADAADALFEAEAVEAFALSRSAA